MYIRSSNRIFNLHQVNVIINYYKSGKIFVKCNGRLFILVQLIKTRNQFLSFENNPD